MMRETAADAVVVGSGFGGAMAARALLDAGLTVRMLERGDWSERRAGSAPRGPTDLAPFFDQAIPHRIGAGGNGAVPDDFCNVGGPSLYFAAVSSRFRARDFEPAPEIVEDSGAEWPFGYDELEPYYADAEALLGIAGPAAGGRTEPYRSRPYPQALGPLSPAATRLDDAARRLGLSPFRLPLAIHYGGDGRRPCEACAFCDGFPCLVGAKNDVAARLLPPLLRCGMRLETGAAATRLLVRGDRVVAVETQNVRTGTRARHGATIVVVSAGALATPGLLLASGLARLNPAGARIGRYLMRHCNAHVFGLFPRRPDPERRFHKEIALDDFYFGHPGIPEPPGKLGMIQQMATPWVVLVLLPRRAARLVASIVEHLTGFIVMAEDQPRWENRVLLDPGSGDGPPRTRVVYRHSPRDLAARAALIRQARRVLREAGAPIQVPYRLNTFSHAVGTVRMGGDPAQSPLDPDGRFRGLENLYVADGSALPTAAGVNPSLTIAATALRTGWHAAADAPARPRSQPRTEPREPA
ncbi:MAG: GMC family oxidoreductase [Gemmatimonadota bacterium]